MGAARADTIIRDDLASPPGVARAMRDRYQSPLSHGSLVKEDSKMRIRILLIFSIFAASLTQGGCCLIPALFGYYAIEEHESLHDDLDRRLECDEDVIDLENDVCPVRKNAARSRLYVDYGGFRVHLCREACEERFLDSPEIYLTALLSDESVSADNQALIEDFLKVD
ncbi:MAG: hypothetical protein NUW37_15560 [Planctomycetes bacterium]|nr:hypothetical protein [Planctomycetota bacterium]